VQVAVQQADQSRGAVLLCGAMPFDVMEATAALCAAPAVLFNPQVHELPSRVFPGLAAARRGERLPPNVQRADSAAALREVDPCALYAPSGQRVPADARVRAGTLVAADLDALNELLARGLRAYPVAGYRNFAAVKIV
jgi:hypothetical protein